MNCSDLWCMWIGFLEGICCGDLFFFYLRLLIVIFYCLFFLFNGSKVEFCCYLFFEIKCSYLGVFFIELLSKLLYYFFYI